MKLWENMVGMDVRKNGGVALDNWKAGKKKNGVRRAGDGCMRDDA